MGPFVEVDHPRVKSGDLSVTDESGAVIALTSSDTWNLLGVRAAITLCVCSRAGICLVLSPDRSGTNS
jgi:hypothetical protein